MMLCSDMDLNECVFVFEPMICLLQGYCQTHTDDCASLVIHPQEGRVNVWDLLYNLNQVKSPE